MRRLLCLLLILSPTLLAVVTSHHEQPQEPAKSAKPSPGEQTETAPIRGRAPVKTRARQNLELPAGQPIEAGTVNLEFEAQPAQFALNR